MEGAFRCEGERKTPLTYLKFGFCMPQRPLPFPQLPHKQHPLLAQKAQHTQKRGPSQVFSFLISCNESQIFANCSRLNALIHHIARYQQLSE